MLSYDTQPSNLGGRGVQKVHRWFGFGAGTLRGSTRHGLMIRQTWRGYEGKGSCIMMHTY